MVWWRAAIDETVENNVWFGLGFGYDLADRFVRQYFPDSSEDFTARSPHNVLITVFARMGLVGAAAFLVLLAIITVRTWRALRGPARAREASVFWCAAWVILICACFGVVLEGPMGAVVFWTLLGLANSADGAASEMTAAADEHAPAALPTPASSG
jgi:O-antigen ligase